ncbi:hypothetical protein EYC84_000067 [Monilinia fructicola]|uniref:G-protein coupled receptors family 1 profile domain-containing protein n=1 Tax=Monilinia fructicola TaxID=38448 RepID=A0A5M9JRJ6_MONFR|nr:hypothetical protein EYC84_000067 [Monilinia fructicola]
MAPLPIRIARTMLHISTRDIGDNTNEGQDVSDSEGLILQTLALTFASVSVASSLLAFYWFVRMRRSFRHDLIMLLIQSDMFKALWFMIFPIVIFLHGPVSDNSKFCQISGFFLALGIEASDISVLMVAVHSALYIFRPKSSAGEGGLYPYRRIAYTIWIVYPILTASLAFINSNEAYVAQGTYCYLPVRPFWYRLALSWIPRYIIFVTILTVYVSIYFYVRFRFRGFENSHSQDSFDSTERARRSHLRRSVPPPLTLNGLVTEPRRPSAAYVAEGRKQSATTLNSLANMRNHAHQFMWTAVFHSRNRTSSTSPPSEVSTDSFAGASTPQPVSELTNPSLFMPQQILNPMPTPQYRNSWRESFIRRLSLDSNGSIYASQVPVDINPVLQRQADAEGPEALFDMHLVNSDGQNMELTEMIRTREKIRRQLRFLFIYPLVYLGMWIIPFISHILQFNDDLAVNPPFALSAFDDDLCLCAGCCGLLAILYSSGLSFVEKARRGKGMARAKQGMKWLGRRDKPTRGGMRNWLRGDSRAQTGSGIVGERGRGDRSWWDVAGIDALGPVSVGVAPGVTPMSPVQEEFFLPTDDEIDARGSSEEIREHSPTDTIVEDSENNEKGGA